MNTEKLNITFSEGQVKGELIIREVDKVNELPVKEPIKTSLSGIISAPYEFLIKRTVDIATNKSHVIVNREKLTIELIISEDDQYLRGSVIGSLKTHPKMEEFGINTKKNWNPNELGQFFKMNKVFFSDKSENMSIVTALMSFEAKVNTVYEKEQKENGNFKNNYSGVVTSNLPSSFKLSIPLFKGSKPEVIEVEIYSSVNGREVSLQLFSSGAVQALEEIRDTVIDEQISKISLFAPEIAIIEQ